MGAITVAQEGRIGAPADLTYRLIADDAHRQQFLPEGITDFEVVEGGVGAGTLHRFTVKAGGRAREYLMRVDEPQPGRVLTETDQSSSLVTTFTVTPAGDACIASRRDGAAPAASEGSSSGRSRRGCCARCTPTSWRDSTATPANRPRPRRDLGARRAREPLTVVTSGSYGRVRRMKVKCVLSVAASCETGTTRTAASLTSNHSAA